MEAQEFNQSQVAAKIWGRVRNTEGKDIAKGRDRISAWASGHKFPDAENLEKLTRALGATATDLEPES
jgi:hypothetical protein